MRMDSTIGAVRTRCKSMRRKALPVRSSSGKTWKQHRIAQVLTSYPSLIPMRRLMRSIRKSSKLEKPTHTQMVQKERQVDSKPSWIILIAILLSKMRSISKKQSSYLLKIPLCKGWKQSLQVTTIQAKLQRPNPKFVW
jgi:hypothetical protein